MANIYAIEGGKEPAVDGSDQSYSNLTQLLLDARMGIDREKLQEIDEKVKKLKMTQTCVANKNNK
jgi:hypothetical protein